MFDTLEFDDQEPEDFEIIAVLETDEYHMYRKMEWQALQLTAYPEKYDIDGELLLELVDIVIDAKTAWQESESYRCILSLVDPVPGQEINGTWEDVIDLPTTDGHYDIIADRLSLPIDS